MKILQLNSARNTGGGERHLVDLTTALAARGHEVHLACASCSPLIETFTNLKIPFLEIPLRHALDVKSAWRLRRFIDEENFEIVHAHLARDYPLATLAVLGNNQAKLILTRHLTLPLKPFHRLTFRRSSRIIAVSHAVARSLQPLAAKDKIKVIHNGINTARFNRESATKNDLRSSFAPRADFVFGFVGELRPHKGVEDFLRAAAIIVNDFPAACFLICGADPTPAQKHFHQIVTLIEKLNLASHVHLIGWLEQTETFYHAIDAFVSPSRVEPFGLVIIEAMASRLPVIATRTDGAREIIENQVSGLLVDISDVEDLAAKMRLLITDTDLCRRLAARAEVVAVKDFDAARMTAETEAVYYAASRAPTI